MLPVLCIWRLSGVSGAYGKCTASELANAFSGCIYSALEVGVGPLAANCSCATHFASSPAAGEIDDRTSLFGKAPTCTAGEHSLTCCQSNAFVRCLPRRVRLCRLLFQLCAGLHCLIFQEACKPHTFCFEGCSSHAACRYLLDAPIP